jgi:dynein light intermediate chain
MFCYFLNKLREWTEDGQLWVQYVSSTPATRLEVINLQEQLDNQLQQRQARETGICSVREELYSQCFGKLLLSNYSCNW